ncbi:hypothetical protein PHMEG_00026792 [Phytophthora megakarya]|uniref:Eukaryotic/viral aspartic protease n=1 Tax=Phytophthora megakarya TaxID=4795 RepID=A0A225V8F4_9STRA|nr:hypothetical protein PHMEG_00026792 [Phytophthora megakarya]
MHEPGKCPMEEFYNLIRQWYVPNKHAGMLPANAENKLNYNARQVGIWYEPNKQKTRKVSKLTDNTCKLHEKRTFTVASLRENDYSRSDVIMELDLLPGESRGYWKYHAPGKWFKLAKPTTKINNEKTTLLFDSGDEVSIVDSTFASKVGCAIRQPKKKNAYMTEGRTRVKITLAGAYVYYLDAWIGELSDQEAILGMYPQESVLTWPTGRYAYRMK